jgi:hypothetical protein
MWTPAETLLGTHAELETFSHSIQYIVSGEEGGPAIVYSVRITPQQTNPDTVTFTTGTPGVISGFYKGIFNDSLTTRSPDGILTTITTLGEPEGSVFTKVDRDNVFQVISFKADTTRSRELTYLAEALDNGAVISSKTYTILAQDTNWTPGQLSLKELISYASN